MAIYSEGFANNAHSKAVALQGNVGLIDNIASQRRTQNYANYQEGHRMVN